MSGVMGVAEMPLTAGKHRQGRVWDEVRGSEDCAFFSCSCHLAPHTHQVWREDGVFPDTDHGKPKCQQSSVHRNGHQPWPGKETEQSRMYLWRQSFNYTKIFTEYLLYSRYWTKSHRTSMRPNGQGSCLHGAKRMIEKTDTNQIIARINVLNYNSYTRC